MSTVTNVSSRSSRQLMKEFQKMCNEPIPGISVGLINNSLYNWSVVIQGPSDTLYEGGIFKAQLTFPTNYPDYPPKMKFITEIFHPNIYTDGYVCISILHPPGKDPNFYEQQSERWLPVHSVSSVLLSVVSMLSDPNIESPANVEAAIMYRSDQKAYKKKVLGCVRASQEQDF